MSDLVGNPEDRFSRVEAHIVGDLCTQQLHKDRFLSDVNVLCTDEGAVTLKKLESSYVQVVTDKGNCNLNLKVRPDRVGQRCFSYWLCPSLELLQKINMLINAKDV